MREDVKCNAPCVCSRLTLIFVFAFSCLFVVRCRSGFVGKEKDFPVKIVLDGGQNILQ